jgi:hypothetical protein
LGIAWGTAVQNDGRPELTKKGCPAEVAQSPTGTSRAHFWARSNLRCCFGMSNGRRGLRDKRSDDLATVQLKSALDLLHDRVILHIAVDSARLPADNSSSRGSNL